MRQVASLTLTLILLSGCSSSTPRNTVTSVPPSVASSAPQTRDKIIPVALDVPSLSFTRDTLHVCVRLRSSGPVVVEKLRILISITTPSGEALFGDLPIDEITHDGKVGNLVSVVECAHRPRYLADDHYFTTPAERVTLLYGASVLSGMANGVSIGEVFANPVGRVDERRLFRTLGSVESYGPFSFSELPMNGNLQPFLYGSVTSPAAAVKLMKHIADGSVDVSLGRLNKLVNGTYEYALILSPKRIGSRDQYVVARLNAAVPRGIDLLAIKRDRDGYLAIYGVDEGLRAAPRILQGLEHSYPGITVVAVHDDWRPRQVLVYVPNPGRP
jgi:hypothetical protein